MARVLFHVEKRKRDPRYLYERRTNSFGTLGVNSISTTVYIFLSKIVDRVIY
ncbi:MAG: hypothetical protein ACI90V_012482 [Bacillariaceae sp.]|jgi:hypothetical protein